MANIFKFLTLKNWDHYYIRGGGYQRNFMEKEGGILGNECNQAGGELAHQSNSNGSCQKRGYQMLFYNPEQCFGTHE